MPWRTKGTRAQLHTSLALLLFSLTCCTALASSQNESKLEEATARQLASISNLLPNTGTRLALRLKVDSAWAETVTGDVAAAAAGRAIQELELFLRSGDTFSSSAAKLKLVLASVSVSDARGGACTNDATSLGESSVNMPFADTTGASTTLTGSASKLQAQLDPEGLLLKMGGDYKVCYSDTGTFAAGNVDLLDVTLRVSGAYDSCGTEDCLANKRYNCYARKGVHSALGSCTLSFEGFNGNQGKATWSEAWTPSWEEASGALQSLTRKACGSTPDATVWCPQDNTDPVCQGTDRYIEPESSGKKFVLPETQKLSAVRQAYTFAACYCPALGSCNTDYDFAQQVGMIYLFTSKLCELGDASSCEASDGLSGVAPQHRFNLMVYCAPNGCPASAGSRVKLIPYHADNDIPSWDSQHGCRTALQTPFQIEPINCLTATNCALSGGSRQDWKFFADTNGFLLSVTGTTVYEARNFHSAKNIDICFCADACEAASNWFKVGSLVMSPYRFVNLATQQVTTMNVVAKLGFYLSSADQDSIGLQPSSIVKLLPDATKSMTDESCGSENFDSTLLGINQQTVSNFVGQNYQGDASQLVYDGGVSTRQFRLRLPGIIAVCYCPKASCVSSDWVFAAHYEIKGPRASQGWSFSTGIPVRVSYVGFDLDSSATLRIVRSEIDCQASDQNPESDPTTFYGCPYSCSTGNMNLATYLLDQNSVRCDFTQSNCESIYVRSLIVQSAATTKVEFTGNPGLQTGDRITIGQGVQCGAECTGEQLALATGTYPFGNSGTYNIGITVTATSDANTFTLPIGWSSSVPKFEVSSGKAHWKRVSEAITAEELKSNDQKVGLKLCWGYGGDGSYVTEVGLVDFQTPPEMESKVSLTSAVTGQASRIIIGFRTGDDNKYLSPVNSMQLKVIFLNVKLLEPYFTNQEVVANVPGWEENSMAYATQGGCGKLFHELWSLDDVGGFPMPKGCYWKVVGDTRELCILFEPKNGLRPLASYQIVLTAAAKNGLGSENVVDIKAMSDVVTAPYTVVEAGSSGINKALHQRATGADPQFAELDGFTILGGTNSILELAGEQLDLRAQVMAHPIGRIVKESILRLFMWPLTQFDLSGPGGGTSCTATCEPSPGTQCDKASCRIESVASGAQKNVIHLVMDVNMDDITDTIKHIFRIRSLTLPPGGFFPGRIGVQVSTSDDTSSHYVISSGAYVWRQPNVSSTVSEIVTREGDGNSRPFRGQSDNVLYLHLVLGATLHVEDPDQLSSFSVLMPMGYTSSQVSVTPRTLGVFSDEPSTWGTGTLDPKRWFCIGNECKYTLAAHEVVYAGSSIYIGFTVTNPQKALPSSDPSNRWYVKMGSPGSHTTIQTAGPLGFRVQNLALMSNSFSTNVEVLGKLTDACLQPTDFRPSASHNLNIFFKTEQSAGFEGYLLLDAPSEFEFGTTCTCGHLAAAYYSTTSGPTTYPLPNILRCTGSIKNLQSTTRNRATIQLHGHLRAGRIYAFQIAVTNPSQYDTLQQMSWQLRTLNKAKAYMDGTADSVSFVSPDGIGTTIPGEVDTRPSWGLFQNTFEVGFNVEARLPWSFSVQEARIIVFPLRVPEDVTTTLRVTAPYGYTWFFSDQDFVYTAKPNYASSFVAGATADLPGGVPLRRGNVLRWAKATYLAKETYGFFTTMRVPNYTPTQSSNAFFVEFGYDEAAWEKRMAAALIVAEPVRALQNAHVDYTTNVQGSVNRLQFTVMTATSIPFQGGLLIRGPRDFQFSEACYPTPVGVSKEKLALPIDIQCDFQTANTGESQLRIAAGEGGIPAGYYEFELVGVNPKNAVVNTKGGTGPCGWDLCWTFYSLSSVMDDLTSPELDAQISVPAFTIASRMVIAKLLPLDGATRGATGRNDQPLQPNWLTFAFQLSRELTESHTLVLRGPAGFVFAEDCLTGASGGIRTSFSEIFGRTSSSGVMQMYHEFETGVFVTECEGVGPTAYLQVGAGLTTHKSYIFSIHAAANPERTPPYNKWSIEFAGESSLPFDGITLWTFTSTSVKALTSSARSQNLVNFTFAPYNSVGVDGNGLLTITPPFGYTFSGPDCDVHLESVNPLDSSTLPPTVFNQTDYECSFAGSVMVIQWKSAARHLVAGHVYTLMAGVQNPSTPTLQGASPASWAIRSFAGNTMQNPLDAAAIVGFAVNKEMPTWRRTGAVAPNGGTPINDLALRLAFPDNLNPGDTIVVRAPNGYVLTAPGNQEGQSQCNNLRWGPGNPAPITYNSRSLCEANMLVVQTLERNTIVNGTQIDLRIGTANPPQQPVVPENYWHAQHINPSGTTLSSAIFRGWQIVPLLEQVQVLLTGANLAAGSYSDIEIRFIAVRAAAVLTIDARLPAGFDFSTAFLPTSGQFILSSVQTVLRIGITIVPGELTRVVVRDVKLALEGGPTLFDITTLTSNLASGTVADQKLGFSEGFRLPGSIAVSDPALQSSYSLSLAQYPVKGGWPAQLGTATMASFTLEFSNKVDAGQKLVFKVAGYEFQKQDFTLQDLQTKGSVEAEVSFATLGELRATVRDTLVPGRQYKVSVRAMAPQVPPPNSWTIQSSDGGALPTHQAVIALDGVQLVAQFSLQVSASRSPPGAEVEMSVSAFIGEYRPTLITLIAPYGFSFPSSCLVDGGPTKAVTSCSPGKQKPTEYAGRPTALLRCVADNLQNVIQGLKVSVLMPMEIPTERSWYIEGSMFDSGVMLGWGEDTTGFSISPMQDVSIFYAAVPSMESQVAIRFLSSESINRGGLVKVLMPSGFTINCAGNQLQVISLPGILECRLEESSLSLMLNDTLTPGEYGFGFIVRTPSATPSPNLFSILLISEKGAVQDAAMKLPGQTIQDQLSMVGVPLLWTSSEPGQASSITMGFRVLEVVDKGLFGSILITFPENVGHAIEFASSVKSKKDMLPLRGGQSSTSWLDFSMVDRIILLLDLNKNLSVGEYQLEFPVTVPEYMPAFNVWLLTLCRHSDTGACLQPQGSLSVVTFPFAGFRLHQALPPGVDTGAAQAKRNAAGSLHIHQTVAAIVALLGALAFLI